MKNLLQLLIGKKFENFRPINFRKRDGNSIFGDHFFLIFTTIYFTAHFFLQILLSNITAFAPDEELYLEIYLKTNNSTRDLQQQIGWPISSQLFLDIIYGPARLLELFGLSALNSIRVYASLMSYSAISITYFFLKSRVKSNGVKKSKMRYLIYFYLIPTNLLWTSLGLRESFLYLGLAIAIIGIIQIHDSVTISRVIVTSLGLILLSFTKTYLSLILSASVFLALGQGLMLRKTKRHQALMILALMLVPVAITIATPGTLNQINFLRSHVIKSAIMNSTPIEKTVGEPRNLQKSRTLSEINSQIGNNSQFEKVIGFVLHLVKDRLLQEEASLSLQRQLPQNIFPDVVLTKPITILRGLYFFLCTPNFLNSEITTMLWVLGFETPLWLVMYLLILAGILYSNIANRKARFDLVCLRNFLCIYTFLSVIGEINIGTALRHRSILIIPMILYIYILRESKTKNFLIEKSLKK